MLWHDAVSNAMVKRNILALQRTLFLLITKACRTTLTAALQVMEGTNPAYLEIIEDALVKGIKRNMNTTWKNYEYREKEVTVFEESLSAEIEGVRSYFMSAWEEETHGRDRYNFIQDVSFAIRNSTWFVPNRFLTYLMTGYGPINCTLQKRNLG